MKVLLINGSPKVNGNTAFALSQMAEVFAELGIETETIQVGNQLIRGCQGCGACYKLGKCVFNDDIVNETAAKLAEADGMVVGSPVYYASPNGTLISFLDRLFYSNSADLRMKVGASIVCARRGGTTAAMDVLNKYFTISQMPVASSSYWNIIHGGKPGEAAQDAEGIRTMRNLAKNMAFMMKAFAAAKDTVALPEPEPKAFTNFIR